MILVDTNVLVALVDERDALHGKAARALRQERKAPLVVISAVLSEAAFLLERPHERRRLRFLLQSLEIGLASPVEPDAVLTWMERYEDHAPDWVDAELVLLSQVRGRKVWTYDREFVTTWRRSDGSLVPLLR